MAIWKKQEQPSEQPARPPARRRRPRVIQWQMPESRLYPSDERRAQQRMDAYAREHWKRSQG